MANVFISYARSTAAEARRIADALQDLGYSVWRDDELPAHRAYAEVIEERLAAATAVVVLWSAEAVKSHWVQSEADRARQDGKLVQVQVDATRLPMPFDQIQCADLIGWNGEANAPGWRKALSSIRDLAGEPTRPSQAASPRERRQASICVLPFANMSGDPEQEYFSDGVCEDVITDLSKVSALFVVARNTAFTLKGKAVDVQDVARRLNVSHVLEGSVRKSADRVRITAQLIDGASGGHVWGERYDRDFEDIFALQDEISQAIVGALKLKLLPEEKRAIEQRGTSNAAAYKLYLMARQFSVMGNERHLPIIARLCRKATELDPGYAQAWAQLAIVQSTLDVRPGSTRGGDEAAARALALGPRLAEAHAAQAARLFIAQQFESALASAATALALDPDCLDALRWAGWSNLSLGRLSEAIDCYERLLAIRPGDFRASGMVLSAYEKLGDRAGAESAARRCLAAVEDMILAEPDHGSALGFGTAALALLGEADRAKDWAERAMLLDPDNANLRYNLACAMARLGSLDAAVDLLEPLAPGITLSGANWMASDPDLDPLRAHPRFQALLAAVLAQARSEASDEPS